MPATRKAFDRKRAEYAVERLLDCVELITAALDAQDGDPDLEPSLGTHPFCHDARYVDVELAAPYARSSDTRRRRSGGRGFKPPR